MQEKEKATSDIYLTSTRFTPGTVSLTCPNAMQKTFS